MARADLGAAVTLGALSGDALYSAAASYAQSNTFAWTGLMLNGKTLAKTTATDPFFGPDQNGLGFLSWALKSADGWPAALTDSTGVWTYSVGKLPVLTKFASKMNSDFPKYMKDLPNSGTAGNKTDLRAAIAAAEALPSTNEVAMWAEVQKQLNFARQANDLYDASQAEIDAAKTALTDAMAEFDRLNSITFVGDGETDATAYEISDLDRLLKMNRLVNSTDIAIRNLYRAAHYKLTADINMTGVAWSPLGGNASGTAFTGSFDGGGKTISNLELIGTTHLGFFGYTSGGATITNLTLKDFRIEGTSNFGSIVGYSAATTTIRDCAVSGTITANGTIVGGITGYLNGIISGCTAEVDILDTSGSGNNVGGIVGSFVLGTIENCSVRNYRVGGAIANNGGSSSNGYTGGIVGGINSGANVATIANCQVKANITGTNAGGIVGYGASSGVNEDRIVISGCWFDGMLSPTTASAAANLGGIAGVITNNFRITNCRSDGTIIMAAVAGGILGRSSGNTDLDVVIANCYTTMRIGNGLVAGGLVGDNGVTNNNGKLVISNSFALNELVSSKSVAQAVHAFGEDNSKLDYTFVGVKAWNGTTIRLDGEDQAAPSGTGAVSYDDLQAAACWPLAFQSAPWVYVAGKLPVLAGMSGMSADFPTWMTNPGGAQDIADTRALLALVSSTSSLIRANYTAESWEELTETLDAAGIILRNDRATQTEVDAVATALQAAIDGLEPYKVDTTLAGEGTADAPFLIGSAADYEEMSRLLGVSEFYRQASYKLTNNIDLLGVTRSPMPYTTATNSSSALAFAGDFDGGGFTISNLTVKHTWGTGMFGYLRGARIHDLNLANCDMSGSSNTGAIAGYASSTTFENINVTGTVKGSSYTGGIVGIGTISTMKDCHFEGTVETNNTLAYWVGGLAGTFNSSIEDCSFKGNLTYNGTPQSQAMMGGIVGQFGGGDIKGCYVEANIVYKYLNGDSVANTGADAGGIVGRFDGEGIIDCHFSGTIDARGENVGGIVGDFKGSLIQSCTSEGDIVMNFPNEASQGWGRPAGGIVGNIDTSAKGSVVINEVSTSMGIDGFAEAGGIAGTATGSGSLTISNSDAMNKYLNNATGRFSVDPFFFGEDSYYKFTGTFTSENNYIWEDMLINGTKLSEFMKNPDDELSKKYGNDTSGVTVGPGRGISGGGSGDPGDGGGSGIPGDGSGTPGDGSGSGDPGGGPSGPGIPGG
ncbi:MAG: hypothetical protein LBK67_01035, partial [Coriobacteriales bacterium]|nr:hypothetical protein [Coriobacteriales bacterium]